MEEGKLYCEHCGEDIHIVPDFEPEIEYNMAQTLNNIAKEMAPDTEPEETDSSADTAELQDWDESTDEPSVGNLSCFYWCLQWWRWYVQGPESLIPIIIP